MRRESDTDISAADRDWIAAIDRSYRPEPMNAWRQAAFQAELGKRVRESRRVRRNWLALAASATAALALWLATQRVDRPASSDPLANESDSSMPVVYAFVTPERYGASLLPDDYAELASVLGLEDSGR